MARNHEQNEKMRNERREAILKEALRQFAQKGLSATKISDIAEGVGMSQGLLYHYFGSKEEIFAELIAASLDKLSKAVINLHQMELPAVEKIKLAVEELVKTIKTSDDFCQTCMLIAQATNSNAIPQEARELIDKMRDFPYIELSKVMAKGIEEGNIVDADPYELAVLFWTSINGLAIYRATRGKIAKIPEAGIIIKMFNKGE
ncbi:MAG TPA: TetR/AcrR family transcriptional regulator [Clostridia bacterium]|nr:TetR/AcrR family transcriptional regulator [Clostridia bacterium]